MPAADVHGSGLAPKGMPRTSESAARSPSGSPPAAKDRKDGPVATDPLGEGEALGGAVVGEEIAVAGDGLEGAAGEEDEVADVAVAQGLVGRDVGEPLASGGGAVVGRQVDEELDDAPGFGPRGRRHGVEEIPGSALADGNGWFADEPEDDRVVRLWLEWSDRAVEAPVRLVVRPGVGGRFGEVEEGVDARPASPRRRGRARPARGAGRRSSDWPGRRRAPTPAGARGPAVTR